VYGKEGEYVKDKRKAALIIEGKENDYYFFLFFSPGPFSREVGHFVIGRSRKQTNKINLAISDKGISGGLSEKMT